MRANIKSIFRFSKFLKCGCWNYCFLRVGKAVSNILLATFLVALSIYGWQDDSS